MRRKWKRKMKRKRKMNMNMMMMRMRKRKRKIVGMRHRRVWRIGEDQFQKALGGGRYYFDSYLNKSERRVAIETRYE